METKRVARRKHGKEFQAEVVQACRQTGAWVAAIALISYQAGCVNIVSSMRSGALDLVLNGAETLKTEHDELVFAVAWRRALIVVLLLLYAFEVWRQAQ